MAHRLLIVLTAAVLATLTVIPARAEAGDCMPRCWEQYHACIRSAVRQGFLGIFHRIRDCDRQLEACKARCRSDGPIRPGIDVAVGVDLAARATRHVTRDATCWVEVPTPGKARAKISPHHVAAYAWFPGAGTTRLLLGRQTVTVDLTVDELEHLLGSCANSAGGPLLTRANKQRHRPRHRSPHFAKVQAEDGEPPPQPSTAGTRCVYLPAQNNEPQHRVGCWPIPAQEARR
jgi:hypothetical protein